MKIFTMLIAASNIYTKMQDCSLGLISAEESCVAKGTGLEILEKEYPGEQGWGSYRVLVGEVKEESLNRLGFYRKPEDEPCSDPQPTTDETAENIY